MSFAGLLNETVTISRRDAGVNDLGEPVTTFTDVAMVRCTVQQDLKAAFLDRAGENHEPPNEIWFPIGTDIRINDRVTRSSGQVLRVASFENAAGRSHHIEARTYQVG